MIGDCAHGRFGLAVITLRLLLAGFCLADFAAAQPTLAETPVTARLIQQGGNDYYSVVSNRSESEMTAYAIVITMYGNGRRVRHYYDVRMLGRPAIKPGASVQEFVQGIALGVRPLVAVFADGTTFGSPTEVADLMNRRNTKLSALSGIASILCDAQRNGLDRQTLIASLENGKSKIASGSAMAALIVSSTFNEVINKLRRTSLSSPGPIGELLQEIQISGTAIIEDPIKDPNGNPYINISPAQLSCR
jgi:hypothetical protein